MPHLGPWRNPRPFSIYNGEQATIEWESLSLRLLFGICFRESKAQATTRGFAANICDMHSWRVCMHNQASSEAGRQIRPFQQDHPSCWKAICDANGVEQQGTGMGNRGEKWRWSDLSAFRWAQKKNIASMVSPQKLPIYRNQLSLPRTKRRAPYKVQKTYPPCKLNPSIFSHGQIEKLPWLEGIRKRVMLVTVEAR